MSVDQCSNGFVEQWDASAHSKEHGVGSAVYSRCRAFYREGWYAALKNAESTEKADNSAIASAVVDLEHIRDNEVRYLQIVIDRLNNLSVTSQ